MDAGREEPPCPITRSYRTFLFATPAALSALKGGAQAPSTAPGLAARGRVRSPGAAPSRCTPSLARCVVGFGLLRARGKARYHQPCLNLALRQVPHERRCARDPSTRWVVFLE